MHPAIDPAESNDRFGIHGHAKIVPGNGGRPKIQISTPAASAEIYLHGAQVTSWKPAGAEEVIFLSQHSRFEDGKAIRGGIPVCFPWFRGKADDAKAPAHGFARTRSWQLESLTYEGDTVVVTLVTQSDEASRKWWPYEFRLTHRITVGADLKLDLSVSNTGPTPFHFEEALHTYNRVGEVKTIRISGLNGVTFLDNRDANREKPQQGDLQLVAQTDNAYLNTQSAVEILDPKLNRTIRLEKQGSLTTVVWNPWSDGASSLADLGDEEWREMACVEAANILGNTISLAPGEEHTMAAKISVTGSAA